MSIVYAPEFLPDWKRLSVGAKDFLNCMVKGCSKIALIQAQFGGLSDYATANIRANLYCQLAEWGVADAMLAFGRQRAKL